MSLRVYNTLSRQKEIFEPVRPGKVGIYLCGPTVYDSPHIGHMVGPVIFDAIKRYLRFKGFEVTWVVNITDVDDKIINAAQKKNMPIQELAEKYTKEYLDCLAALGIDSIDLFPRASEHMGEMIELSKKLIKSGHAYAVGGNVWFEVSSDPDYGKLSNRTSEEQEAGTRDLEGTGKRSAADFALWKAARPGEPAWDSPWGRGRPGWHLECSAMSMKYLGDQFDIHGGGMDLMFPHHENELAQSQCASGKPLAKYWLHNGLTKIKTKLAGGQWADEKMSKSLGNVISAREATERYGPELLRYLLLSTHYRRPIEFSDEALAAAKKGYAVFPRLFERIERLQGKPLGDDEAAAAGALASEVSAHKARFLEMMDDDFNTAGGIAAMHELAGAINGFIERNGVEANKTAEAIGAAAAAGQTLRGLGRILGLFRFAAAPSSAEPEAGLADQLMQLFIQLRNDARKTKNFALADAIRNGLGQIGVTLEDRPDGTGWRKG